MDSLVVGWLHRVDRNKVSLYGCHSSSGGQSLLRSASAVETQDLPSGSECQVRAWTVLVRYYVWQVRGWTQFCEGWSVSSCVLERALKLGHL